MKPLPFPADTAYNSKTWYLGNTLVKGAVMAIILPWWLSGCKELPPEDTKLMEMAGLAQMRWSRNRDNIRMCLDELTPRLQKIYKKLIESKAKQEIRNEAGKLRLMEYNRVMMEKRRIKRLNASNDIDMANGLKVNEDLSGLVNDYKMLDNDSRVDRVLPSRIPGHGEYTANSFKHKPPKPLGTLRDK